MEFVMHCHKNASWRWCSNSSAPSGWSMDTTQSRGQGDFHAIKWRDLKRIWSKSANHGLAANPKTRPTNLASWNTRNQWSLPRTRLISCEEPPSSHKTLVTLPMDMQRLVAHLHVLSCSKCKMLIMIMMLAWFEMTCQHKTGLKLVFYKKKYQPSTRGHDRNEWEEIDGNEDYFIVSLSGVVQFSWILEATMDQHRLHMRHIGWHKLNLRCNQISSSASTVLCLILDTS